MFVVRYLILVLFLFSWTGFGQIRSGTTFRAGMDRIGIYMEQSLNLDLRGNQLDLGLRYYGPDYFFEHDVLGIVAGSAHYFEVNRWYAGPAIRGAFFHENKSSSEVYLGNILLAGNFGFSFNRRWSVFSSVGVGAVFNRYINYNINEKQSLSYVNYELAFGIKYFWRVPADN